jgi:hypothetical protein
MGFPTFRSNLDHSLFHAGCLFIRSFKVDLTLQAVLGQTIDSGTGRTLATVLGAVGGAVAGGAVEEELTKKDGLEIIVKLDGGKVVSVVQEADVPFQAGWNRAGEQVTPKVRRELSRIATTQEGTGFSWMKDQQN